MKLFLRVLILAFFFPIIPVAHSGTYIDPHIRMDGTYVPGHYQNATKDNTYFQTRTLQRSNPRNINPYTGQTGYESPYSNYNINEVYPYGPYFYYPGPYKGY